MKDRYPTKDATAQTDGDFVLYATGGGTVWSTYTGGRGSSDLALQSDGDAVLYKDDGGGASSGGSRRRSWACRR